MAKDISNFIINNFYLKDIEKAILLYYDNDQNEITQILNVTMATSSSFFIWYLSEIIDIMSK